MFYYKGYPFKYNPELNNYNKKLAENTVKLLNKLSNIFPQTMGQPMEVKQPIPLIDSQAMMEGKKFFKVFNSHIQFSKVTVMSKHLMNELQSYEKIYNKANGNINTLYRLLVEFKKLLEKEDFQYNVVWYGHLIGR